MSTLALGVGLWAAVGFVSVLALGFLNGVAVARQGGEQWEERQRRLGESPTGPAWQRWAIVLALWPLLWVVWAVAAWGGSTLVDVASGPDDEVGTKETLGTEGES